MTEKTSCLQHPLITEIYNDSNLTQNRPQKSRIVEQISAWQRPTILYERADPMADDRLRIPVDEPYLRSVGLAMICFAHLEWNAVWCGEKMQPGYLLGVAKKTAGQIALDLVALTAAHPDPKVAASLGPPAAEFKRLVGKRNDLVHANPTTAPNGDQRLFRNGVESTIASVAVTADEFVTAEIPLNHCLHYTL